MSKTGAILFVFTSADKLLNGAATGWYLPEAAHPYYALAPHFRIDSVSPNGGEAPIDDNSVKMFTDEESQRFLNDPKAQELYKKTKKVADVNAADYDAIFVIGGHGPLIDLAKSTEFAKLVEDFYTSKKPVAAVCHGPGALVLAKNPATSKSIISGVNVTGFSNAEEAQTPYNDFVNILPFSLEDKLQELGGKYSKAEQDWGVKVIWDQGVLTGQNPASAGPLGEKLREILLA
ncbi:hypothetical protein B9479_005445 [Cryptococcus floricola]|uniref:D-lactate dehydratase n=1 Tax=Cryptococcus floricola TaxID=2591691 RepID=A0A5D3AVQ3_9TREE|nr:hypothetical protein B9479_005445 [Cryptococcus floricola]